MANLEKRYFHEGRVVSPNLKNMSHIRAKFESIGFDCLLDINEQFIPRFVLEFYCQLTFTSDEGQMFVEFVIQNQFFSYSLEEFAQILDIPYEGACVFTDRWRLNKLAYGIPSDGPYQTNLTSIEDIISPIQIDRDGQVRRIRHEEEIDVLDYQVLTREIEPTLKPLEEIIRENVFCLGIKEGKKRSSVEEVFRKPEAAPHKSTFHRGPSPNAKITLRVGDDEVIFDVDQSIKIPSNEDDECYGIDDLDNTINAEAQELLDSSKFQSHPKIKKRQHSHVLMGLLITKEGCLLGYDNAPASFQDACRQFFNDWWKTLLEVFLDGTLRISVISFYILLSAYFVRLIARCEETNLVLNWEQCHFMVKEGIVVGHKISGAGFDIEIKDKRGAENLAVVHLSRLENPDLGTFTEEEIVDEFPDEHLMVLKIELNNDEPWGHHSASVTGRKVYESRFFWPTIFKDAKDYVIKCDACQRSGNISSRSEIPQNNIQVEAQALPTNDARVVIKFLRRLFARFGVPKALITYHPQTNGQTKVTNRAIKRILERSVGYNLKNWSERLDDALWVFKAAYKTPTGCTPFRLVYGKSCHLPVEIEHKAYWVLKQCNMDLIAIAKNHFIELNELMKLEDGAYKNTRI
ncbi:reverse transcriptase domain-containing protein [Tanacetum coccineum]